MHTSFEQLAKSFQLHLESLGLTEYTIRNYKSDLNHFLSWYSKEQDRDENILLNKETVIKYLVSLYTSGTAIKTINRRLATLRRYGKFLKESGLTKNDFMKGIRNFETAGSDELLPDTPLKGNSWAASPILFILVLFILTNFIKPNSPADGQDMPLRRGPTEDTQVIVASDYTTNKLPNTISIKSPKADYDSEPLILENAPLPSVDHKEISTVLALSNEDALEDVTLDPAKTFVFEEVLASPTGRAVIASGSSSVTIRDNDITPASLIFITPASPTDGYVLYIERQTQGAATIAIDGTNSRDIHFNWLVQY